MKKLIGAAVLLAASISVLPALSANAEAPTQLTWTTATVTAPFGSGWSAVLHVTVSAEESDYPVRATDGTVDVYVDGVAGAWATGLPVQDDGHVFVAQQSSQPLLTPGDHSLTAIYTPAGGSYTSSAATPTPLVVTIDTLELVSTVAVDTSGEQPRITASMRGPALDSFGGPPPGTWTFTVIDQAGKTVWTTQVAQRAGESDPVAVPVDATLARSATYAVSTTFLPAGELAGGVAVTDAEARDFTTNDGGVGAALGSVVPVEPWGLGLIGAGILALIAAVIVLAVRRRRAATNTPAV